MKQLYKLMSALGLAMLLMSAPVVAQVVNNPMTQSDVPPGQEGKLTLPESSKGKKADSAAEEADEIIMVPGPSMHSRRSAAPSQPTPKMFEALYKQVWLKIGTEYAHPEKLNKWIEWRDKYDGKLNSIEELEAALKAMTQSLGDRWTVYKSSKELVDGLKKMKEGMMPIGMALSKNKAGLYKVDFILKQSPVHASVLREGDAIKSINGTELSKLSEDQVTDMLAGKVGEKFSVVAIYDNAEHTVEMEFAPYQQPLVEATILPGKIGYISLPTFMDDQGDAHIQAFVRSLTMMHQRAKGELNGLIFDLRYNTGGRMDFAQKVIDLFLESGTVITTTTRKGTSVTETHYKVAPAQSFLEQSLPEPVRALRRAFLSMPIVVLINGTTASASEVTAGALKDNGRAYVIGEHSFGKAVGFGAPMPLPTGGALQVTSLVYVTPNGTNISATGILPDKVVAQPRGAQVDEQLKAAHEYLIEIAKKRVEQLGNARDTAAKVAEAGDEKPFRPTFFQYVIGLIGALVVLMIGGFAYNRFRLWRIRRNRY